MIRAEPFLQWPGGKRRLLPRLRPLLRTSFDRYIEPFIGGGAVFFDQRPHRAVLGDVNPELVHAYQQLRDVPDEVLGALRSHEDSAEHYYATRDAPDLSLFTAAELAARYLYLNRCGFNGLQRQGPDGRSNVAYGGAAGKIFDERNLRACSLALQGVTLVVGDFEQTLGAAKEGDLAFIDSPYWGTFANYVAAGFSVADQERLARLCTELSGRGVKLVITNSDVPEVRTLYREFRVHELPIRRGAAGKGSARTVVNELCMTNFEPDAFATPGYSFAAQTPRSEPVAANNQQGSKPTRAAGRLTTEAARERQEFVAELQRAGVSRGKIHESFRQRFGGSARTIDTYIRSAKEASAVVSVAVLGPNIAEARKQERDTFLDRLATDIEQAKAAGVWSAVAALRRIEADARGLRQLPPVAQSGQNHQAQPAGVTVNVVNVTPEQREHRLKLLERVIELQRNPEGQNAEPELVADCEESPSAAAP